MATNCSICGRELTNSVSVIRGIGPICRSALLKNLELHQSRICDYRLEFIEEFDIVIIHEIYDRENPKISLTNCIEFVIKRIVEEYELCINTTSFVEHSTGGNLFGPYHEYDLVDVRGEDVQWKYLWHNDISGEKEQFSNELLINRINKHKLGIPIFPQKVTS